MCQALGHKLQFFWLMCTILLVLFQNFSDFLDLTSDPFLQTDKVVIDGNFNIHVDVDSDSLMQQHQFLWTVAVILSLLLLAVFHGLNVCSALVIFFLSCMCVCHCPTAPEHLTRSNQRNLRQVCTPRSSFYSAGDRDRES